MFFFTKKTHGIHFYASVRSINTFFPKNPIFHSDFMRFSKPILLSQIHIFEPVPQFCAKLEKKWSILIKKFRWNAVIHQYGLGAFDG